MLQFVIILAYVVFNVYMIGRPEAGSFARGCFAVSLFFTLIVAYELVATVAI
jgi:hypothetical protein